MDASEMIRRDAIVMSKTARDHDLPIGLDQDGRDGAIGTGTEVNRRIERAVHIQAGHTIAGAPIEHREIAAEENLSIQLDSDDVDAPIGPVGGTKLIRRVTEGEGVVNLTRRGTA